MVAPVIQFEIGGRGLAEAAAFYERVFGWTSTPHNEFGRAVETGAAQAVTGLLTDIPDVPEPYVMIYIQVDDIAQTLEAIHEAGGQSVLGPLPTPDGRQFAWFKDPAGNRLGLLTPSS